MAGQRSRSPKNVADGFYVRRSARAKIHACGAIFLIVLVLGQNAIVDVVAPNKFLVIRTSREQDFIDMVICLKDQLPCVGRPGAVETWSSGQSTFQRAGKHDVLTFAMAGLLNTSNGQGDCKLDFVVIGLCYRCENKVRFEE
jgi:hypothetical protein